MSDAGPIVVDSDHTAEAEKTEIQLQVTMTLNTGALNHPKGKTWCRTRNFSGQPATPSFCWMTGIS